MFTRSNNRNALGAARICAAIGGLLAVSVSAPAAAQWQSVASLPQPNSGLGACADDLGNVFALGGIVSQNQNTAAAYMFDGSSWNSIPALPQPRSRHATLWSDGFVYVIGGTNAQGHLASAMRMDITVPVSGWSWDTSFVPDLPTPTYGPAGVVDARGRIWIIGGLDERDNAVPSVFIFDPARPQLGWVIGPSLNQERFLAGAAMDRQGRLYAIGGTISGQHLSSVERFDPLQPQNGWEYVADIPGQAPQVSLATTGRDGGIYIAGGWTGSGCMNRTLRYDSELNVWAVSFNLNSSRNSVALASSADGYLYAIGGDCVGASSAVERMFPPPVCPADVDRNGFITGDDFDFFAEFFENGCP